MTMATEIGRKPGAAAAPSRTNPKDGRGEYALRDGGPSGQEWILDAYSALEPRSYLAEFTSRNVRPDGRPFPAARPVAVLPSIFARNAHGSAMVTLGGRDGDPRCTRVVAACTLLVGRPSPSTPDEGDIDVTLAASPLSGPRFDLGGRESGDAAVAGSYGAVDDGGYLRGLPGNLPDVAGRAHDGEAASPAPSPTDVKEIESWVRRTLRSSRFVDPTELGIERGVAAWRVRVSMHLLNHEGNAWDAALLCACAALSDLRLPATEVDEGVVRIVTNGGKRQSNDGGKGTARRRGGRSLTLGPAPVPLTVAVLPADGSRVGHDANVLLADPTRLEEDVAAGNAATVVCNAHDEIVEFHKKGGGSRLSAEQVAAVAAMGFGRARELGGVVLGG